MIKRLLQPFYTFYVTITFVVCLLAALPLFFIIGTFDKSWARRMIWNIAHYWAIGWLFCIGQPMIRKGPKPGNKKYIYVANHISYIDVILIYAAIPYFFRTLGKKEMVHIPLFGFVYKQLAILVDRSSAHSRARSSKLMWRLLKYECNIAIFPEGTFNETGNPLKDFYDGAFKLAINTQTPILPVVFPDTVRRWHYSAWWKLTPGKNRVIFLDPIEAKGYALADLPILRQKVYDAMEAALINTK